MNGLAGLVLLAAGATCPPEVHPSYAVAPDYAEAVELSHVSASGLVRVKTTVSASGEVCVSLARRLGWLGHTSS